MLGRSRNGPENLQKDENEYTRKLAEVYKDHRANNEGACLRQIENVEAGLKTVAKEKAGNEGSPTCDHEAKGPDDDPPDDSPTSRARRVHFDDDHEDALEHGRQERARMDAREHEIQQALTASDEKRTACGNGGRQDPTDDRDLPRYQVAMIYKDGDGSTHVRNLGANHGPEIYEVDLPTRQKGNRHTVGDDEAVDIFDACPDAGKYAISSTASVEERGDHFNRRHGRKKTATRRTKHAGADGPELHGAISNLRGSNAFSVKGTNESDAACLASVRQDMPHRTRALLAERHRQDKSQGPEPRHATGGESDESEDAAAEARTLGQSDDLCRGLRMMGGANVHRAGAKGPSADTDENNTTLCCTLSSCPSTVRVRQATIEGEEPCPRVAEVQGSGGEVLAYNLDGGGAMLAKLVEAGKIVLVVIDTAADRSHCDPNNPNLVETFALKQAITAIMANGTTTRLERGGILELHFLDAFGNAKCAMISVLLTPGMGDMILMSGTDVATHLGQLRGPDGSGGRASICQLSDHDRGKDMIDDRHVTRRFPLCIAQGPTGGKVDQPAESGASYLAIAMPREEGPRPGRQDIAALTHQYLRRFEGANDHSSRVRMALTQSMGSDEAAIMMSELEDIRAAPSGVGGEKAELEAAHHAEGLAGLEQFQSTDVLCRAN
ncbi:MAG: hypothetical protein OSB03_16230, partial [Vicinamibacterales bacterium]|nr:hypothetical protein [Vicinamibacterales bacterium]